MYADDVTICRLSSCRFLPWLLHILILKCCLCQSHFVILFQDHCPIASLQLCFCRVQMSWCALLTDSALHPSTSLGFSTAPHSSEVTILVNLTEVQKGSLASKADCLFPQTNGYLGRSTPAGWTIITKTSPWTCPNQVCTCTCLAISLGHINGME